MRKKQLHHERTNCDKQVRVSIDVYDQINTLSRRYGITKSKLVSALLNAQLLNYTNNGTIELPVRDKLH